MKMRSYRSRLAGTVLQPDTAVGLHEAVPIRRQAVQLEVALGPVQIGVRHVDGGRRRGTTGSGVHRRRARVGEEIQEALSRGSSSQTAPRDAMVEEQAGIEVVVEVHQELQAVLHDDVIGLALLHLAVLLAAFVLAACSNADALLGNTGDVRKCRQGLAPALTHGLELDLRRRGVFLDVKPVQLASILDRPIHIDRKRILRHISVIQPIARHATAVRPRLLLLEILSRGDSQTSARQASRAG